MVAFFQKQPDGSLRGPIDWYLHLGWEGDPEDGVPIQIPVSFANTGAPYTPQTPLAPSITAVLTSRTTVDITWIPGGTLPAAPAAALWEVEVSTSTDGGTSYGAYAPVAGSPFDPDIFELNLTGLPTGTPEIRFRYQVRGINGDGNGAWSPAYTVFWGGVVVNPPNRPTNLTVTNITTNSAQFNWTAAIGASTDGATRQGLWSGNVDLAVNIDPSAVTFLWSGLPSGTTYSNINVRRFNAGGWSGGSNWLTNWSTEAGTRQWPDDPVMGQSVPDDSTPYRTQIPAIRVYNQGDLVSKFNQFDPQVIAYTDDPFAEPNNSAIINRIEGALVLFYEGAGSDTAARQNCEMHVTIGNEIDRMWQAGTTLPQIVIDNFAAVRQVIHQTSGGTRRFPNATMWIDMTANNIRSEGAGPRFKPLARYLDGHACSYYPAGRTITAADPYIEYNTQGYPPGSIWAGRNRNNFEFYIDPIFDCIDDWRATGGPGGASLRSQITQLACWELGIGIHHSLEGTPGTAYVRGGAANVATDITQKPRYLVGGARTTGVANQQYNFKGVLNHIHEYCVRTDISMREMLYWNQQKDANKPNLWESDEGKTNPDSVTAWYMWQPGFRLPNI